MKSTGALPHARMDGLVITEVDHETLVYDKERDQAHCLNQTAAFVWRRCDGKTTDREMAGLLQKQLRVPVDIDVVRLAIKQLQRFHLLENSEKLRVAAPDVSRRKLLLKYAPAAFALPVIMTIVAPTAAQGGSPCSQPTGRPETCPCSGDTQCASQNCNGGACGPDL